MDKYTREIMNLLKDNFEQVVGIREFQMCSEARSYYLADLSDNLCKPMEENALKAYGQGSGNEIASGKMNALRSSSALTYNLFDNKPAYVRNNSEDLRIGSGVYSVEFEKQYHTLKPAVPGNPANLDAFLYCEETAEAISKRLGKKTIESGSIRQSVSLLDYNGDKTTNLIGRDLMTPEEVMGLHYKTIIFPIIGYPIFRDTVMYKKFSCYENGTIERKLNPLKDLSNTYFTVEDIKHESKNNIVETEKELYEDMAKQDKERLKPIEKIIKKIFKQDIEIRYNQSDNYRIYMQVTLNRKLNMQEQTLLKYKIKNDTYKTEITENKEETIINIHNINLLEKDFTNNVIQ